MTDSDPKPQPQPQPNKCPPQDLVCTGNPDDGTVRCSCKSLWDCSQNPNKCTRDAPAPDGGGGWQCRWDSEFKYTCTKPCCPGDQPPDGGGGWICVKDEVGTSCTITPPVPDGGGGWKCKVEGTKLVCERPPPPPVIGGGNFKCVSGVCTDDNGLPKGGSGWKCHQTVESGLPTWVCVGDSPTPPDGGGKWSCVKKAEFEQWQCTKPVDVPEPPPGGMEWQCTASAEFGIQCYLVKKKKGDECIVGEKMWCDGLLYCGWGQVECDPATGKWKKTIKNGKEVLDCTELKNQERPNTVCACYHFYFNPMCCERPDCIIPSGSKPQICAPSKGGLCDYCNPQKPECKQPDSRCVITNDHETFCGQGCGAGKPCPAGYQCMAYKLSNGLPTNQCVPSDFSCYF